MSFLDRILTMHNDLSISMVLGGIVGSFLAVYQYEGISPATMRPVVEPLLNSLGLIWPEGV